MGRHFHNVRFLSQPFMPVECVLTDGELLTPQEIRDLANRLWEQAEDTQEVLAAEVERSQAAVSKALRKADESETRYVKICIDIIEYYCDDVTIRYPRGKVETSS